MTWRAETPHRRPVWVLGQVPHLVLQLGDLPLAGRVVLQVVQHDLGVGQEGLGALEVLPQPLLRLDIPLADLEGGKEAEKGWEDCIGCALAPPWRTPPCKMLRSKRPAREEGSCGELVWNHCVNTREQPPP